MNIFSDPRFWVSTAFVIFFVIFGKKLWGIVVKALDDRAAAIRADLEEAVKLRKEAEQLIEDAKREKKAAEAQVARMLDRARQEADELKKDAERQARESAAIQQEMAQAQIRIARDAAISALQTEALDLAIQAASRIVAEEMHMHPAIQNKLIQEGISSLPNTRPAVPAV